MTNSVDFTGRALDGKCYCALIDKTKISGNIHTSCGGIINEEKLKEATKETKRKRKE